MPQSQLTSRTSAICLASITYAASAAAGTVVLANLNVPRTAPVTTSQNVPGQEYWYITDIKLPAGTSVSTPNSLFVTVANFTPQRIIVGESEVQQNIYNKTAFGPNQWIQLPPNAQWYVQGQSQVANGTAQTVVVFQFTLLMVPLSAMG